jgi:hypothetical protein
MRVRACAGLLAASWLCLSPFAFAGEQVAGADGDVPALAAPAVDAARLDLASVGPARLAKVDRMLAATGFGATYDRILALLGQQPLPADATPDVVEDRRVRERMAALISWQSTRNLWRAAFAQMLSDEVLDGVSVFHESEAGRAIVACMTTTTDMLALSGCQMPGNEDHRLATFEFMASPDGRAYEQASQRMVEPVMRFALRRALEGAPEDAASLASICQRKPGDELCKALPAADAAR